MCSRSAVASPATRDLAEVPLLECVAAEAALRHLEGFSGPADADALMAWRRHLPRPPQPTRVVDGEPAAADAPRLRIRDGLGWRVSTPDHGTVADG